VPIAAITASIGVLLLLLAFALNLAGGLERRSLTYQALNVVGAALSCYAAVLIAFWPFVVLEGCWVAVAGVAMANRLRTRSRQIPGQAHE
jgi:phosphotransferase system  glucose/maltose/N-acetylglucosamine-specific IIC component